MMFYLLFVVSVVATPYFLIKFFDDISQKKPCIKNLVLCELFFQLTAVFLSAGSGLGANAVFAFGWFTAVSGYCAACFCDKTLRIKVKTNIMVAIIAVCGTVAICCLFGRVYPQYSAFVSPALVAVGVIVALGLGFALISFLYDKYDVFKGFCRMMTMLVFILAGIFGTVAFVSDGICEVMVVFVLTIHREIVSVSMIAPVMFGLITSWFLVSENFGVFMRKLSGCLVAVTLVMMVVGEVIKTVAPTNTVMMIDSLDEIVTKGGYHESIIVIISLFGNMFRTLGCTLVAGCIAALMITLFQQKKNNGGNKEKLVVSVEQMRKSDEHTIKNGVSGRELMKRAAQGIFDAVEWENKKVVIVAGGGNNGGDGYALAEILAKKGNIATVCRFSDRFSDDGKFYFDRAEKAGIRNVIFDSSTSFAEFDIVVDCIFGTGFKGTPEGIYADAINKINESGAYVVSADINSGMNGDTGEAVLAVKSDITVSIGYYKSGMFEGKAPELIGKLVNVDIGIILV